MPKPEHVWRVIGEWVEKAENDLKAARHLLELGEKCPTDVVCFHAQQGIEKYLKALLVMGGVPVPKTHDIERIISLLPPGAKTSLSVEEMRLLTGYATESRYPGYSFPALTEAREAVSLAGKIRGEIRAVLPQQALVFGRDE